MLTGTSQKCVFSILISPLICSADYNKELGYFVDEVIIKFLERNSIDYHKIDSFHVVGIISNVNKTSEVEGIFQSIKSLRHLLPHNHISKFSLNIGYYCGSFNSNAEIKQAIKKSDSAAFVCSMKDGKDTLEYSDFVDERLDFFAYLNEQFSDTAFTKTIWPVYQPIFDKKKNVLGYECLLRMKGKKEEQLLSPYLVVNFLDKTNQGEKVLSWFVKKVITEAKGFVKKDQYISINIAPKSIAKQPYINSILKAVSRIDGNFNLVLEITEIESPFSLLNEISQTMSILREKGVKFALDDFGTGNSNFDVLFAVKPDYLKLDKLFVDFLHDQHYFNLLKHLCSGASEQGFKVIIEGVETESNYKSIIDLDIYGLQGFYLGKPEDREFYSKK